MTRHSIIEYFRIIFKLTYVGPKYFKSLKDIYIYILIHCGSLLKTLKHCLVFSHCHCFFLLSGQRSSSSKVTSGLRLIAFYNSLTRILQVQVKKIYLSPPIWDMFSQVVKYECCQDTRLRQVLGEVQAHCCRGSFLKSLLYFSSLRELFFSCYYFSHA